jgi:hypothetical protein
MRSPPPRSSKATRFIAVLARSRSNALGDFARWYASASIPPSITLLLDASSAFTAVTAGELLRCREEGAAVELYNRRRCSQSDINDECTKSTQTDAKEDPPRFFAELFPQNIRDERTKRYSTQKGNTVTRITCQSSKKKHDVEIFNLSHPTHYLSKISDNIGFFSD